MIDLKRLSCALLVVIVSISFIALLHRLPMPAYCCSVCHSTNISASYYQKRGFLSQQKCFFCYNCQKEYNINLREERRGEEKRK